MRRLPLGDFCSEAGLIQAGLVRDRERRRVERTILTEAQGGGGSNACFAAASVDPGAAARRTDCASMRRFGRRAGAPWRALPATGRMDRLPGPFPTGRWRGKRLFRAWDRSAGLRVRPRRGHDLQARDLQAPDLQGRFRDLQGPRRCDRRKRGPCLQGIDPGTGHEIGAVARGPAGCASAGRRPACRSGALPCPANGATRPRPSV